MKRVHIIFFAVFFIMTSCKSQNSAGQSDLIQKENLSISGDTVDALGSSIMVVYQDRKNVLWFGSWETGVYRYDGSTLINFNTKHGLPSNRIDEIKEDGMGNVYLVSCSPQSSIVRFDGKTFKTMKTTPSNDWKLNPNDIWFRHEYGKEKVYRFDGNIIHELTVPKPPDFNNPYEIYSIYTDSKGNVWFGTNPLGVCRFDGHAFNWITEEDVTEFRNEGANGVRSITEDVDGDFWFNTENLYSIYDSTTVNSNRFYTRHESIGGLDGKPNSNLDEYLSTVMDNDKNLWFVTYRDGVWKYDGKNVQQYKVQVNAHDITLFSIYKDNSGTLWLGSHENGVFRFNGESFESFLN